VRGNGYPRQEAVGRIGGLKRVEAALCDNRNGFECAGLKAACGG